jgi:hypothetical protein
MTQERRPSLLPDYSDYLQSMVNIDGRKQQEKVLVENSEQRLRVVEQERATAEGMPEPKIKPTGIR